MSLYQQELADAVTRTTGFNLKVPAFQVNPTRLWLNPQTKEVLSLLVQHTLGIRDLKELSARCLTAHRQLGPVISNWLGCPVLYTLGWLDDGNEGIYRNFNEAFIAEKLHSKHWQPGENLHAWLTLPSMEIIDVTLSTTIGKEKNLEQMIGVLLLGKSEDFNGVAYKPVLVGDDFLTQSAFPN